MTVAVPASLEGSAEAKPAPAAEPARRIDYLDGIRAVAAIWVVLSHIWITQYGLNAHTGLFGVLTNWTLYSHLAVDVFIVLSGFCLILPRLRKPSAPFDVINFYYRRAHRILPPYYCALALGIVVSVSCRHLLGGGWHLSAPDVLANVFLVQDALISRDTLNGPLWSVAVEWRIYFLFPLIVLALFRYGRWSVVIATALLGYGITTAIFRWAPTMLLSCPWYIMLFGFGVCAGSTAFGKHAKRALYFPAATAFLSLLALGYCLWKYQLRPDDVVTFGLHMPLIDSFAGLLAASLLVVLGRKPETHFSVRLLSWRPLAWIGVISYSLYLVHMPTLIALNSLFLRYPIRMLSSPLDRVVVLLILGIPITLSASYGFFWIVERPLLNRKLQKTTSR